MRHNNTTEGTLDRLASEIEEAIFKQVASVPILPSTPADDVKAKVVEVIRGHLARHNDQTAQRSGTNELSTPAQSEANFDQIFEQWAEQHSVDETSKAALKAVASHFYNTGRRVTVREITAALRMLPQTIVERMGVDNYY